VVYLIAEGFEDAGLVEPMIEKLVNWSTMQDAEVVRCQVEQPGEALVSAFEEQGFAGDAVTFSMEV